MFAAVWEKVQEGWKAVLAFLIPALFGLAAGAFEALGDWVVTQDGIWVGVVVGLINGVVVWLKSNKPAPTVAEE